MSNASELAARALELEKAVKRFKRLARVCEQAQTLPAEAAAAMDAAMVEAKVTADDALAYIVEVTDDLGDVMRDAGVPGAPDAE